MLNALITKDKLFFEMFEKSASLANAGARAMDDLMHDYPNNLDKKVAIIKDIEHRGDDITHQTIEMFNKTFVTPIDREDIHKLITRLDDILDLIDGASSRLALYKIDKITPEAHGFAELLVKTTELVGKIVVGLKDMKTAKGILPYCIQIHTYENEGDQLLRKAMTSLFEGKNDPIDVIKWKEIYEDLEAATDRCEDAANTVEGIVMKYA
jgi:predicted phosphate transport protein (TIGR00153 family)